MNATTGPWTKAAIEFRLEREAEEAERRSPTETLARVRENKRQKFDAVDLIEGGLSPDAIGEAADRACRPVALSSAKAGPTPLSGPETASEPYPIDALGDVLAPAAHAIAAKVQCADAMAAQSVLAVASLAVKRWRTSAYPLARQGR